MGMFEYKEMTSKILYLVIFKEMTSKILYLVIFKGNISDLIGKCGRVLGVAIFIFNISFKNVSYVVNT